MTRSLNFFKIAILLTLFFISTVHVEAQISIATTSLEVTNCGNSLVETGEQCDVPGDLGLYSTTIAGRQCTASCKFGPYCGDGVLQTIYSEECDDGNNTDGDFCAADCTIEPAGSGGGGSTGGGSGGSGGSSVDLGDTSINITGIAYPNRQVNIVLDAQSVGNVRANSNGDFEFAIDTDPGAASIGFWATDIYGIRSITFNTTFDVTQGAVTNLRGILLPPTIMADNVEINPGDTIVFSGQAAPNSEVELHIDNELESTVTANSDGTWGLAYATGNLSASEHIAKARYRIGSSNLSRQSSFSTALTLFVGVDGRVVSSSDLNSDGEVDLIDFSILLFWWQTPGGDSNPPADINSNGNVGIEDFSILLFNWTG
jgi:cysteine-rich repeat protein